MDLKKLKYRQLYYLVGIILTSLFFIGGIPGKRTARYHHRPLYEFIPREIFDWQEYEIYLQIIGVFLVLILALGLAFSIRRYNQEGKNN